MEQALEKARAEWMVYENSRALRETIREERHELKNNYFHLLVLMREGDTEAVKTELEDRIGSLSKESHRVETGVAYLDHGYGLKIVRKTLDESDGMLSTEVKDFNFTCLDVCPVRIGDNVFIGPNVTLATPMHPLLPEERNAHQRPDGSWHNVEYARPITIGDDCWLASNVVVCGGVTVGEGSVIGAGSVVTKDIPPHSLAVGNPCRVVREITEADWMKQ